MAEIHLAPREESVLLGLKDRRLTAAADHHAGVGFRGIHNIQPKGILGAGALVGLGFLDVVALGLHPEDDDIPALGKGRQGVSIHRIEMEGEIIAVDVNAGQGVLILAHTEVGFLPRVVAKHGKPVGNFLELTRRAKAVPAEHTAVVPLLCPEHIALVVLTAMARVSEIQTAIARPHMHTGRQG